MSKLDRTDLMSLETYSEVRGEFRQQVMTHKKARRVAVGPHVTLHFEDRLVMQYQIQEMLRIEKIFDAAGIQEELDTYNPLIPDGTNFKATMMIEFPDPDVRAVELSKMVGIELKTYVQIGGLDRVFAIADEDMERDTEEKTSSVHFLRFELTDEMVDAAVTGEAVTVGIDHLAYGYSTTLNDDARNSLVGDLQS